MQTKANFILMTVSEFGTWLSTQTVTRTISTLQNHHTYIPSYAHFKANNHFALLSGMDASHRERGFDMIAQNITTFPDGMVAICRPFDRIPAGIKGANTGSLCLEHIGNFDAGGDTMTAAHRVAILQVNALLARKFSIVPSPQTLLYHHWWDLNTGTRTDGTGSTKSCPGTAFFGGNTVAAAQAHFIPEVLGAMGGVTKAPAKPLRSAKVTADALNVRDKASTDGKVLSKLIKGTAVDCYEDAGDWSRLHPSKAMWASRRYLAS